MTETLADTYVGGLTTLGEITGDVTSAREAIELPPYLDADEALVPTTQSGYAYLTRRPVDEKRLDITILSLDGSVAGEVSAFDEPGTIGLDGGLVGTRGDEVFSVAPNRDERALDVDALGDSLPDDGVLCGDFY